MKTDIRTGAADSIDVAYVANLARMALTAEEASTFQRQLEDIVGYMRKIAELNLDGIEPTSHPVAMQNVMRADEVQPGLDRALVIANAPRHTEDQFLVPKIVE